jgi:large subunit ribosomal protein L31
MKANIHPKYYKDAKVVCACGNTFTTGSTIPEIRVEICSVCHPFYTGESRYVDTLGRVDRFKQKQVASAGKTYLKKKARQQMKRQEAKQKADSAPKSLKDMLMATKKEAKNLVTPSLKQDKSKTS